MGTLPLAVLENIRNKETVLFVGAGFSVAAGFPAAKAVASFLAKKLQKDGKVVDSFTAEQLDRAAQFFESAYGRGRLVSEVESFLQTAPRDVLSTSHRLLASLVKHGFVRTMVTTNYDTLIEDACAAVGAPIRVVAHESQLYGDSANQPVLYKIHGDFHHPDLLVLTPTDLQSWMARSETRRIVAQLKAIFDKNALLFLGYSLLDFNVLTLLLGADFSTRGAPRHKHFAAVYSAGDLEDATARLRRYEVEAFRCPDLQVFLRTLLLRLPVKLRVQHLVFNYPSWYPDQEARYGGIETFIRYLKEHSTYCSHKTFHALFGGMLQFEPSRLANTVSPTYPASYFFFKAAAEAALETALHASGRNEMPDLIHVHFLEFAPMCEEADVPTLCTSHSLLSMDLAFTNGLFDGHALPGAQQEVLAAYTAEVTAASAARFITVLSNSHEQEVRSLGARSVRRLEAPFDGSQFRLEQEPAPARGRASLPDRYTIAYVGRPDRRKGIEILIRACERLATSGRDFQVLLVGYGFSSSRARLEFGTGWYWFDTSVLAGRGVSIHLRAASGPAEVGRYYSAADVVVVPSLYEPMGYVVLEAMACGRPVVAARVGGIVEAVVDGHNGLLFEPGDADHLAQQLDGLYVDRDRGRRLGLQGRADIERRRPVKSLVEDWEEVYRHVAFAFGESFYPSPELLETIRVKCDQLSVQDSAVDVYRAAVMGCGVARELMAEQADTTRLPEGVPVDQALLRAIATELQRALRRKGVTASYSVSALSKVMGDLALAVLNRRGDQASVCLRADETKIRLTPLWFRDWVAGVTDRPAVDSAARNPPGAVSESQIAELAYDLWKARGAPEGSGDQDWRRAVEILRGRRKD